MDGVSGWKKDSVNITKFSNLGCGLVFCFQESQAGLTLCELQSRRYGIDKDCSWCVFEKAREILENIHET